MTDQCKHCTARGNLKECLTTTCNHHENWYAVEQQKRINELELKLDQVKIGYNRLQNSSTEYDGGCMEIRAALGIEE